MLDSTRDDAKSEAVLFATAFVFQICIAFRWAKNDTERTLHSEVKDSIKEASKSSFNANGKKRIRQSATLNTSLDHVDHIDCVMQILLLLLLLLNTL